MSAGRVAATQWWASSASVVASSSSLLCFEGFGDALVGALAAGGAELVVEAVLGEGVGEPVAPRGVALGEERGGDAGVEVVEELVLVGVGEQGEEVDVELAADHRRQGQHPQRLVAESLDASADDVADAARQAELVELAGEDPSAVVVEHDPARLAEVAEQLAGEERVPVGLAAKRVGEADAVVVEVVARRRGQQVHDVGVVETVQGEAGDVGFAVQIGEQLGERRRRVRGRCRDR